MTRPVVAVLQNSSPYTLQCSSTSRQVKNIAAWTIDAIGVSPNNPGVNVTVSTPPVLSASSTYDTSLYVEWQVASNVDTNSYPQSFSPNIFTVADPLTALMNQNSRVVLTPASPSQTSISAIPRYYIVLNSLLIWIVGTVSFGKASIAGGDLHIAGPTLGTCGLSMARPVLFPSSAPDMIASGSGMAAGSLIEVIATCCYGQVA